MSSLSFRAFNIWGFVFISAVILVEMSFNRGAHDSHLASSEVSLELLLTKFEDAKGSLHAIGGTMGIDTSKIQSWRVPTAATSVVKLPRRQNGDSAVGGMSDSDRTLLGEYYSEAKSVCEFGVGDSSVLASNVGVPRFTGVDSSGPLLDKMSLKCPTHYRWVWADIGEVNAVGAPTDESTRPKWEFYSLGALMSEKPFQVYLVNGRFRVATACMALIHGGNDSSKFVVLFRDLEGNQAILKVADRVDGESDKLIALRRKQGVTRNQILELWREYNNIY